MDAGCNLRYILSNAWEAEGRWWKSYNSGLSWLPPTPKAQEDTIWPTPRPTQHKYTSYIFPPP